MEKDLLLEIINNGIDELKQISRSFYKNELNDSEINIAIVKTETLLKEFILLRDTTSSITDIVNTEHKNLDLNLNHNINSKDNHSKVSDRTNFIKPCREATEHSEKKDNVIGNTISLSKDLNKLINLNDRFKFSRELFNNDMNLYSETIEKLNNISSFENAKKIISSFSWDDENETVIHFVELLTKKFTYNV